MKKCFFVFIIFLIMMITVSAKNGDELMLNSNVLLNYLKMQDLNGKQVIVCNQDYCDYLKYKNLEKSVQVYINDYIKFVNKKTDDDTSVRVSLKGFLITEIIYS